MEVSVVINTHSNSPVFQDTLDSVKSRLSNNILVVVDSFAWGEFKDQKTPAHTMQGFYHGKPNAPYRNVALGLMKACEVWPNSDWYCYLEYDCLIGKGDILSGLENSSGWILGNDHRRTNMRMPFLDNFLKDQPELNYLLGCCLFFKSDFMNKLKEMDFFVKFLHYTNFFTSDPEMKDAKGKSQQVYDVGEYIYPTLAVYLGGSVQEIACWQGSSWRGDNRYPMRFRPELQANEVLDFCIAHPIKEFENPIRKQQALERNQK